ncbi:DUF58 domain-containing protein [Planctomycetota bacterium]
MNKREMEKPGADARRAAGLFRISMPRKPLRGPSGERLSRGIGSSVEFEEFREYVCGDDIRHIDWPAYARTDQLMVRLYREEVAPRVEILLDASQSMSSEDVISPDGEEPVTGKKSHITRETALFFCFLGRELGAPVTLWWLSDQAEPLREEFELHLADREFDGFAHLPETIHACRSRLKPGTLRIIISDFLFPHNPGELQLSLSAAAGHSIFIQVLGRQEIQPVPGKGVLMEDIETGEKLPLRLTSNVINGYQQRLGGLQENMRRACMRTFSPFAVLDSGFDFVQLCSDVLVPMQIIEPK